MPQRHEMVPVQVERGVKAKCVCGLWVGIAPDQAKLKAQFAGHLRAMRAP